MTPYLDIFVAGVPVPQGSLRSSGRGHLFYSNASKLKPWRASIEQAVMSALPAFHTPIAQGMHVEATFFHPRPKTVTRALKTTAGDTDKLFRAVGDALTNAQLYTDDSTVLAITASKWYADEDHPPGVRIRAWIVPETATLSNGKMFQGLKDGI